MIEQVAEMQVSVGFLDPQVLMATLNHSSRASEAIKGAMENDYVVAA